MNSKFSTAMGQPLRDAVFVFPPADYQGIDFEGSLDAFRMKKASEHFMFNSAADDQVLEKESLLCQTGYSDAALFPKEFCYEEKMLEYLDNSQFSFLENSDKYLEQVSDSVRCERGTMESSGQGNQAYLLASSCL